MDFTLTSDHLLIRDTVRKFMESEMRPILREYDLADKFPSQQIRRLGEMGFCGMLVPEEWSGAGADTVGYAIMIEEVARVCASTAVTLSVTNSAVATPIHKYGTDEQKQKYLRPLARGEILGAFCLTEPQAGSDAAGIQTRARRVGDDYHISGTKIWVTNGGVSGVYIVFAKVDAGTEERDPSVCGHDITAFLVEPDFPGFRISRYEDKMGQRLSHSAEILFDDCRVPVRNRLGTEGQGLKIALDTLDGGRIGIAAQAVGIAQGALEASVKYAKQRQAFGRSIAEFQAVQFMLADMQTEIEAARALTRCAAWLRDSGTTRLGAQAAEAKLYASEMANRVCAKAVQIHGSVGYSRETDVERFYRDARVLTIYEGTSEMQRVVISRDMLRASGGA